MKVIKKTAEYTIYQRRDERYAVTGADKNPINGEEKVKILVAEELIKQSVAQEAPAEEPAAEEEAPAEEAAEAESEETAAEQEEEKAE